MYILCIYYVYIYICRYYVFIMYILCIYYVYNMYIYIYYVNTNCIYIYKLCKYIYMCVCVSCIYIYIMCIYIYISIITGVWCQGVGLDPWKIELIQGPQPGGTTNSVEFRM